MCRHSLVAAGRGYSLVAMHGLLIVVASLVEHRLWGAWTPIVTVHGLSCSMAGEIFLDQGLNPCPLHCQADS